MTGNISNGVMYVYTSKHTHCVNHSLAWTRVADCNNLTSFSFACSPFKWRWVFFLFSNCEIQKGLFSCKTSFAWAYMNINRIKWTLQLNYKSKCTRNILRALKLKHNTSDIKYGLFISIELHFPIRNQMFLLLFIFDDWCVGGVLSAFMCQKNIYLKKKNSQISLEMEWNFTDKWYEAISSFDLRIVIRSSINFCEMNKLYQSTMWFQLELCLTRLKCSFHAVNENIFSLLARINEFIRNVDLFMNKMVKKVNLAQT